MWQPPDPEYQNGPIRNYSVYFSKPNRQPKREEVMADMLKFLLQGLSKLTEYKIWVVAGNAKGNSPKSPSVVILTKEKGKIRWQYYITTTLPGGYHGAGFGTSLLQVLNTLITCWW